MTSRPKPKPEAYAAAVALLARREHARTELARKLAQRDYAADEVEAALDRLAHERLLSDERFAEQFVRGRIERGSGPHKIRAELRERGVDDAIAANALAEHAQAWRERVHEVRRKRFGDAIPADYRERARQMRFLQARGFDAELISAAMKDEE